MPTTTNLGQVRGPVGPAGPAGAQGAPGADGSPVQWDSGWFAINTNETLTKTHGLNKTDIKPSLLIKDTTGKIHVADTIYSDGGGRWYGCQLVDITSTQIKIRSGAFGIHHTIDAVIASGFARIIV